MSKTVRTFGLVLAGTAALALAACGTNPTDRTEGGAAVGAGTGAVIGAACCFLVGAIPGALIGGAIGAGTGAATNPNQVDLGQPVWKRGSADTSRASELSSN